MKINEAYSYITPLVGTKFGEIFNEEELIKNSTNKGLIGQLIEKSILGLKLSNKALDFEDGELKSHACRYNDTPAETISVCQIQEIIDDLLAPNADYTLSKPYLKMKNMLIIGKADRDKGATRADPDRSKWFISHSFIASDTNPAYENFYKQVLKDLKDIFSQIREAIEKDEEVSTTNGKYIQVRTKGAGKGKDKGIFSKLFNKKIANKTYAVYIKLDGVKELMKINNGK
jgi:DNA mismatch repair protein MutH